MSNSFLKKAALYEWSFFSYTHFVETTITLPKPHAKQVEILNSPCRRKVVCAGRRGGKTTMLASYSVQKFLEGERVIYGTPVAKQLRDYWGLVKKRLKPLIASGYIYKNETDKYLRWAHDDDDGPMISAQTAYDSDTWRGGHGSLLIYDEFAYMHPSVWEVVGVPMLLDTGGEAWFISTPNRKNHFHALYMRGLDGENGRWAAFKFTSYDNPYLDKNELQHMVEDMSEDNHKQEILAEFLENEGAVFRNVGDAHTAHPTRPEDHIDHFLIAGIDWGKRQDYTVISILCADCKQEVSLTRFNKIDYTYQRQRLINDMNTWNVQAGLAELNAMGEPNLELLQLEGLPINGFWTTGTSKPPLIENLVRVVEKQEYRYLPNPIAQAEMEAYEVKINPLTNRPSYSAPDGVNDDTVIARALATWQAARYMPALL